MFQILKNILNINMHFKTILNLFFNKYLHIYLWIFAKIYIIRRYLLNKYSYRYEVSTRQIFINLYR